MHSDSGLSETPSRPTTLDPEQMTGDELAWRKKKAYLEWADRSSHASHVKHQLDCLRGELTLEYRHAKGAVMGEVEHRVLLDTAELQTSLLDAQDRVRLAHAEHVYYSDMLALMLTNVS